MFSLGVLPSTVRQTTKWVELFNYDGCADDTSFDSAYDVCPAGMLIACT